MEPVHYSYLPEGRSFRFVKEDNRFMKEASVTRQALAGDPLYPVGCLLVKEGEVLLRAGNGFSRGSQTVHVCPRVVEECPSGTGYDLCGLHDSQGHAEAMVVQMAKEGGMDTEGADVYLYGHWWCCEPCWNVMIGAGVRDVYLLENAHVEFDRDRVYEQTLKSSVQIVGILGNMNDEMIPVYREVGDELVGLGCRVVISGGRPQVSLCEVVVEFLEGGEVVVWTKEDGEVYRLASLERVSRKVWNVIRQL